ncbi:MAG TPA: LuxR C-terminal-related transcriptional regulator [Euzebya sp.]|nr:LuxR C-terminal-related transcriptional regulator [Euzebya sp.]
MPSDVRDLLLSRVLALPRASRDALRVAAAGGRAVPHTVLAGALGVDVTELEETLRPAFDHNVLRPDPDRRTYLFRHALLAEATASTLLPGEAQQVHTRLATTYESEHAAAVSAPDRAAARARHWQAAGHRPRSLAASVAAARALARMLAFPEALRHYEAALALWDEVDDASSVAGESRATLQREAAEIAHLAARPELAAQLCRAAIDQTDATADPVAAGLLHERLGRYLWMAADGAAGLHAYRRAEALVPADPPTRSRARVLSGLSQALMLAGRMAEARATAEAAIDMAQRVGARDVEGHARNNRGVALASLGDVDAGVALLQQARHMAEVDSDDVDDVARAIVNLCSVLIDAGRLDEAADVALDGVAVVTDLGLERRKGVWCRCDAADALLRSGRWDEAERLIDDALVLDPSGIDHVRSKWMRGVLRLRRGDLDGAAADLTWAHEGMASTIDAQLLGPLHAHLIELWLARGAPERALAIAEEGWGRLSERPAAYAAPLAAMATSAAADLAELAARSRRSPTGGTTTWQWVERCAAALSSGSVGAPEPQAWLLMAQAYHGTALGQADAASWEAAADAWRCAGQPFWHAHAERRQAEVLLRSGDRQRTQSVLRDARARSDALGATRLTADIDALPRRSRLDVAASARPTPGYAAPYRLTRREHQILGLLAEGRTNRQIADQLFVSHRTIGTPVSTLLGKLGASTRSAAAARAHREGLL